MSDLQLVHKIVFFDSVVKKCIVLGKFVDMENNAPDSKVDPISFFMGIVDRDHPEKVTVADTLEIANRGIPLSESTFHMFFNKRDYNEHDLLDDSDSSVAIRIKD